MLGGKAQCLNCGQAKRFREENIWEGINLKKISKKIVSLVTLAAFALTLVPAAAFASDVDTGNSTFAVASESANTLKVTLDLKDSGSSTSDDFTNLNVKVAVSGLSDATTVDKGTNVKSLATDGYTPSTASDAITFTNVPGGTHEVTVTIDPDTTQSDDEQTLTEQTATVKDAFSLVSEQTSFFYTNDADATATVGGEVPVTFEFRDASGQPLNNVNVENDKIVVWATDENNNVTDALKVTGDDANAAAWENTYAQSIDGVQNLKVKFSRSGLYTLHAAKVVGTPETISDLEATQFQYEPDRQTIDVEAASSDVTKVEMNGDNVTSDSEANTFKATLDKANGAESNTHTVTVYGEKGVLANKDFTVSSSSSALRVTALSMTGTASEDGTITTNRNGEFKINYNATAAGTYKVYLTTEDGFRATLNVTAGDSNRYADTIVANETGTTVDASQVETTGSLINAVTYTITDNNGNVITDDQITDGILVNEGCVTGDADYIKLLHSPEKFHGKATNFKLAYIDDTYTLKYTGSDLVAGEYTVRLILDEKGNYADATFTVGNFNANKVESMELTTTSDKVVYTKGTINYKVLAVDANGVAKDVTLAHQYNLGIAAPTGLDVEDKKDGTITVNIASNTDKESVVGTKINLVAASDVYGKLAQTSVTVVDEGVVAGLEFDKTEGAVNKNNVVKATVVDEEGNTIDSVNGQVFAYVVDQSNADAKVDVTAGGNANKGVGSITIFSDKETTVDIVVGIQAKNGDPDSAIYADTLTYTIGKGDINADKLVAMTIGSSDYIVNNDVVKGDAAPYVDGNWRTMVPVRALAETFGAEVTFEDNVITIVDGDKTIVMTVGEEAYTVNDEEKTMDTVPVIGEGDRTFVPTRFVAEALGYTVTPLQDANGLTASVVFQK